VHCFGYVEVGFVVAVVVGARNCLGFLGVDRGCLICIEL